MIAVNIRADKADYVVTLQHEGGKGWGQKDNKVAVFNREGDLIFSSSTVTLGGAVEGACVAIRCDWTRHEQSPIHESASAQEQPPSTGTTEGTSASSATGVSDSATISEAVPVAKAGVQLFVTGSARHNKHSTPKVAYAVADDITAYLKTRDVVFAGELLWEEKAGSGAGLTGAGGLAKTMSVIHTVLDKRLGSQFGLPLSSEKSSQSPDPEDIAERQSKE